MFTNILMLVVLYFIFFVLLVFAAKATFDFYIKHYVSDDFLVRNSLWDECTGEPMNYCAQVMEWRNENDQKGGVK